MFSKFIVRNYNIVKNSESFKFYITGVGVGLMWANTGLENIGRPPLYCQPGKLALNVDNILQILDDYIDRKKDQLKPDLPVEMLLLYALKETFPCKK